MEKNRLRPENLVWKLALWDHIYTVNATLLFYFVLFLFLRYRRLFFFPFYRAPLLLFGSNIHIRPIRFFGVTSYSTCDTRLWTNGAIRSSGRLPLLFLQSTFINRFRRLNELQLLSLFLSTSTFLSLLLSRVSRAASRLKFR